MDIFTVGTGRLFKMGFSIFLKKASTEVAVEGVKMAIKTVSNVTESVKKSITGIFESVEKKEKVKPTVLLEGDVSVDEGILNGNFYNYAALIRFKESVTNLTPQ